VRLEDFKDATRYWKHPEGYALPGVVKGQALAVHVDVYVERATDRTFHVVESESWWCESTASMLVADSPWVPLKP